MEKAGVPYAVGGAIAYGGWAVPRATQDVDLNVFLDSGRLGAVFPCFRAAGCTFNEEESKKSASERGEFQIHRGAMRVDVFVPSIPFYASVEKRVRTVEFLGRPMRFLS